MNEVRESSNGSFDSQPVSPEKHRLFSDAAPITPFRIGNYRILGSLGHGGMGIVYLAENSRLAKVDQPTRRDALKVILPQHMSPLAVNLFFEEMRSLSQLNHRNIATLYFADVLNTPVGPMPYFTMEYIKGARSLTRFADYKNLSLEQRLQLLISAADGIAHAHGSGRAGLAHSDIKPGNLLVGENEVVKIVDFGGAMDLSQPLRKVRVMTPEFAAPEQLQEQRLCLQSDVYALAVVGYLLMAKQFPTQPHLEASFGQPVPIRSLNHSVSREVEHVLLNALQQKPEDRYADAESFAEDLRMACRGDFVWREKRKFSKRARVFCRKNRQQVIVGTVLALGLAGTSWQAFEAMKQRDKAITAADQEHKSHLYAESLRRSTDRALTFVKELIYTTDIYNVRDQTLNIDYLLKAAESRLTVLAGDQRATAIALAALGRIAANWEHFDQAVIWLNRSADLWRQMAESRDEDPSGAAKHELADVLNHLAWATIGSPNQKAGLVERARSASSSAEEAFKKQRELTGSLGDDTLCFQADWLRIRQQAGDGAVLDEFVEFMATVGGKTKSQLFTEVGETISESSRFQESGNEEDAKKQIRKFIAPFIDPARPRLRARVPWSLAQAAESLNSLPPAVAILFGKSHKQLSASSIAVVNTAAELGGEILPVGHPDREKIVALRERLVLLSSH